MLSFFELESQKLDKLYELKIKRKLPSTLDVWLQAKIEACLELVNQDFDPNERNEEGETILEHIIITGRLDLVQFLVEAGANVNICNNDSEYPLENAARLASEDIFNYLEPLTNLKPKHRIFITSTVNHEHKILQRLIASSIDVDSPKEYESGRTALIIAVQQGNDRIVKMLFKAGANPNLKDENSGTSPLISAVKRQYVHVTRFLLENGANVNITDRSGFTALETAIKLQNEKDLSPKKKLRNKKIIDLLIEAGAKNKFGLQGANFILPI